MLIGRERELARLESLLEAARGGRSGSLVLHGDAGVGKTVLLEQAVDRAAGFTVVRTQPLEAESELPFAGLADLVRPIAELLERIPQPQSEALASAVALGPPAPGDRFAAAAATLSLLAAAGADAPVLAVVDDAHWLDVPSREAIVFAGRRLSTESVVLLLGMRDRPWLADTGLETMPIGGLPPPEAAELVERERPAVAEDVRERLVAETGGNPLAILETLAVLSDEELDGSAPLARPIPVGAGIETAFGEQVRGLPQPTRQALLVAAASDSGDLYETGRALDSMGLGTDDLEPAERRGLVSLGGGRVEFRHPLLRSATYQLHEADERRAAHRALAATIESSQPDRIAWHLAAAATGPDEAIAAALEQAGSRAKERRGLAAASRALELAGRLSPTAADRARRLLAAAEVAWLGNDPERSVAILDALSERVDEPLLRADVQLMRGTALLMQQPVEETRSMLVEEADRVEPHDPERAAALLVQASFCSLMAGAPEQARDAAARSLELAGSAHTSIAMAAAASLGGSRALLGEVVQSRVLFESLRSLLDGLKPVEAGSAGISFQLAMGFVWLEEWDTARDVFEGVLSAARAAGAPGVLPLPLAGYAELELRTGNVASAYAAASESVELSIDTAQLVTLPFALATLARIEAVLGHDQACREHAENAMRVASRRGAGSIQKYAPAALGLLELGRGRPGDAIPHLEAVGGTNGSVTVRQQLSVQWAGDLIEAYIRCGHREDAERRLAEFAEAAERTGQRWAAARVARCRGMLAPDEEYEARFEEALAIHARDPSRFEVARTELCLGQRRRRARRRADARTVIHSALEAFEAVGAEPWAEQARAELRATGEAPAPSSDGSFRALTPQELQVALIVAKGATNNETAAALFLSPKTVEFHLHNTYRKLGVRSRAELVRKAGLAAQ